MDTLEILVTDHDLSCSRK